MNPTPLLDAYAAATRASAGILAEIKGAKPKPERLAQQLGITQNAATQLLRNATYFSAEQLADMGHAQLTMDTIATIGRFCRKLSNLDIDPNEFFHQSVDYATTASLTELTEHLAAIVAQHNKAKANRPRADWARFSHSADCDGKAYLNIKAPAADLARIRSLIDDEAKATFHQGHATSIAEAYAHIITKRIIEHSQPATDPNPNPHDFRYRPFVTICHPWQLTNHDGKYATTDGTIIDPVEFSNAMLEPLGWATVAYKNPNNQLEFTPPIEIRARQATDAQRLILSNAHPICAHPDCRIPARYCQIHHIEAYAAGGVTDLPNLVPLCLRHNKENDDDPTKPKNGRIEKDPVTGRIGYRRKPNEPLRHNRAPIVRYGAFEQAKRYFDTNSAE